MRRRAGGWRSRGETTRDDCISERGEQSLRAFGGRSREAEGRKEKARCLCEMIRAFRLRRGACRVNAKFPRIRTSCATAIGDSWWRVQKYSPKWQRRSSITMWRSPLPEKIEISSSQSPTDCSSCTPEFFTTAKRQRHYGVELPTNIYAKCT